MYNKSCDVNINVNDKKLFDSFVQKKQVILGKGNNCYTFDKPSVVFNHRITVSDQCDPEAVTNVFRPLEGLPVGQFTTLERNGLRFENGDGWEVDKVDQIKLPEDVVGTTIFKIGNRESVFNEVDGPTPEPQVFPVDNTSQQNFYREYDMKIVNLRRLTNYRLFFSVSTQGVADGFLSDFIGVRINGVGEGIFPILIDFGSSGDESVPYIRFATGGVNLAAVANAFGVPFEDINELQIVYSKDRSNHGGWDHVYFYLQDLSYISQPTLCLRRFGEDIFTYPINNFSPGINFLIDKNLEVQAGDKLIYKEGDACPIDVLLLCKNPTQQEFINCFVPTQIDGCFQALSVKGKLQADQICADSGDITTLSTQTLTAENIDAQNIDAENADITVLDAQTANVGALNVERADIETLLTDEIQNCLLKTCKIENNCPGEDLVISNRDSRLTFKNSVSASRLTFKNNETYNFEEHGGLFRLICKKNGTHRLRVISNPDDYRTFDSRFTDITILPFEKGPLSQACIEDRKPKAIVNNGVYTCQKHFSIKKDESLDKFDLESMFKNEPIKGSYIKMYKEIEMKSIKGKIMKYAQYVDGARVMNSDVAVLVSQDKVRQVSGNLVPDSRLPKVYDNDESLKVTSQPKSEKSAELDAQLRPGEYKYRSESSKQISKYVSNLAESLKVIPGSIKSYETEEECWFFKDGKYHRISKLKVKMFDRTEEAFVDSEGKVFFDIKNHLTEPTNYSLPPDERYVSTNNVVSPGLAEASNLTTVNGNVENVRKILSTADRLVSVEVDVSGQFEDFDNLFANNIVNTPPFNSLADGEYDVVLADPIDACGPIADATGKFVLVERGNCSFDDKATNAANAGAVGIIVYNNQSGGFFAEGDSPIVFSTVTQEYGLQLRSKIETDGLKLKITSQNGFIAEGKVDGEYQINFVVVPIPFIDINRIIVSANPNNTQNPDKSNWLADGSDLLLNVYDSRNRKSISSLEQFDPGFYNVMFSIAQNVHGYKDVVGLFNLFADKELRIEFQVNETLINAFANGNNHRYLSKDRFILSSDTASHEMHHTVQALLESPLFFQFLTFLPDSQSGLFIEGYADIFGMFSQSYFNIQQSANGGSVMDKYRIPNFVTPPFPGVIEGTGPTMDVGAFGWNGMEQNYHVSDFRDGGNLITPYTYLGGDWDLLQTGRGDAAAKPLKTMAYLLVQGTDGVSRINEQGYTYSIESASSTNTGPGVKVALGPDLTYIFFIIMWILHVGNVTGNDDNKIIVWPTFIRNVEGVADLLFGTNGIIVPKPEFFNAVIEAQKAVNLYDPCLSGQEELNVDFIVPQNSLVMRSDFVNQGQFDPINYRQLDYVNQLPENGLETLNSPIEFALPSPYPSNRFGNEDYENDVTGKVVIVERGPIIPPDGVDTRFTAKAAKAEAAGAVALVVYSFDDNPFSSIFGESNIPVVLISRSVGLQIVSVLEQNTRPVNVQFVLDTSLKENFYQLVFDQTRSFLESIPGLDVSGFVSTSDSESLKVSGYEYLDYVNKKGIQSFVNGLDVEQSEIETIRPATVNVSGLPQSNTNLSPGDLYVENGFVKMA